MNKKQVLTKAIRNAGFDANRKVSSIPPKLRFDVLLNKFKTQKQSFGCRPCPIENYHFSIPH